MSGFPSGGGMHAEDGEDTDRGMSRTDRSSHFGGVGGSDLRSWGGILLFSRGAAGRLVRAGWGARGTGRGKTASGLCPYHARECSKSLQGVEMRLLPSFILPWPPSHIGPRTPAECVPFYSRVCHHKMNIFVRLSPLIPFVPSNSVPSVQPLLPHHYSKQSIPFLSYFFHFPPLLRPLDSSLLHVWAHQLVNSD